MKKLFLILLCCFLWMTGCGKMNEKDVMKKVQNSLDKSTGYSLSGQLEVSNNDELYQYEVVVDHKKDDFYKVTITNIDNQFQQIILKNLDGVFLLTPSLNRSFKFQSDWPYNNSQIYLLDAIIQDVNQDKEASYSRKDNQYVIETKVHYPNNPKLHHQKIVLDSNYQLKKVTVYDSDGVICMNFVVDKIQFSPKYEDDTFDLDSIIEPMEEEEKEEEETEKSVGVIEDVIYPLILPTGTKLVGEEKVNKDSGERVIMTFDGEKSFLLVEETLDVFQEFTIIPSSGEPFQLMDTIGVMTDNSLSWTSGNMEYYLVSDVMSQQELIDIAQSIVGVSSFK